MHIYTLDFETAWCSKDYTLSKMGPIEYIRDSRFTPQMLGIARDMDEVSVAASSIDMQERMLNQIDQMEDVVVGHNISGFDAIILSEYFNKHPQNIWDTIGMMRWTGLSAISRERLESLAEVLGVGTKKPGTVLSDGKKWPGDFTGDEQEQFIQYCADDVKMCRAAASKMLPHMTDDALGFMSLTARMATDPVFVLDREVLETFSKQLDDEVEAARAAIYPAIPYDTVEEFLKAVRSDETFAKMLSALGVEPPKKLNYHGIWVNAFAKTDPQFLALQEHDDSLVRQLVGTRIKFNTSIARTRCETLLKFANYDRPLPIMLSAFASHTGRYSAGANDDEHSTDKIGIQNLSKHNPEHLALRRAIKAPAGHKVVACDSKQIEVRVLAWLAQEESLLAAFQEGRDPYAEFGAVINTKGLTAQDIVAGNRDGDAVCKLIRQTAKTFILGAGYGAGKDKLAQQLWVDGTRLSARYDAHTRVAARYLEMYRSTYKNIVKFWKRCGQCLDDMVYEKGGVFGGPNGTTLKYGATSIMGVAKTSAISIPSGFMLRYPELEKRSNSFGADYYYRRFKRGKKEPSYIYSTMMVENVVSAFAFQILMWQACRMDVAGIHLAANTHDCWATVVPEKYADEIAREMRYYMRMVPSWAKGLPLDAETKIGDDFTVV